MPGGLFWASCLATSATTRGAAIDYKESVGEILKLVDYERMNVSSGTRARYDLEQIGAFLTALGDPHLGIPTIHIAGTKGKGSTASMVASILTVAGHNPGLFTSPHLHTFRERMRTGGELIPEEEFARLVERLLPIQEQATLPDRRVTLFEFLTGMAFCHFREHKALAQVLEVGLGGRLDATNVVEPTVCGITSLGLDHTEVLGDTLDKIAAEKAGIIKPGVPVICAPQEPEALEVVKLVAKQQGSSLSLVGSDIHWEEDHSSVAGQTFTLDTPNNCYHLQIPLLGRYQLDNAAVAVGITEALIEGGLGIGVGDIEEGLRQVDWPCRLEVLENEPLLLVDGAHNPYSGGRLVEAVKGLFPDRRILLLVGVQGNKDLPGLAEKLSMLEPAAVFATQSRHPRATPSEQISQAFAPYGLAIYPTESVTQALDVARNMATKGDLILATGSLFVAAEVREIIKGIPPETYPVFDTQASLKPLDIQPHR